jgi:hypothetical protein
MQKKTYLRGIRDSNFNFFKHLSTWLGADSLIAQLS